MKCEKREENSIDQTSQSERESLASSSLCWVKPVVQSQVYLFSVSDPVAASFFGETDQVE